VFSWTPTEAQGPADYTFTVKVTDDGAGTLSDTKTVKVHVNEVNRNPMLTVTGAPASAVWGNALTFQGSATDPDLPGNGLTYSLVSAPAGATINPTTGAGSWTPGSGQVGTATFQVRVTDDGSPALSDSKTVTISVTKRPTTLVYTGDASGQYSDRVTVRARLSDNGGGALQGTLLESKSLSFGIGSQSSVAATDAAGVAEGAIVLSQAANAASSVTSNFAGDGTYLGSSDSDPFAVQKEDTAIEYTGDTLVSTGSTSTSSTATLRMSAAVTEAPDGLLGSQLGGKQVKFTLYASNDSLLATPKGTCTATLTANSPYDGKATGSCSIAGMGADNWIVEMELLGNGYYAADTGVAAATVVIAGTGFTTGGGWFTEPSLGSRSNFGFTAKYLKNGGVQGNSIYIYRKILTTATTINGNVLPKGEYNWIIKANVMDALSQKCPSGTTVGCTASFTGKSNVSAVNRATGIAYSLGGNRQFQVDVTDNGEPGSKTATLPDSYALKVWETTGTYYQVATPTAQRALEGGNIQVRP
jgi:hypothetical protein